MTLLLYFQTVLHALVVAQKATSSELLAKNQATHKEKFDIGIPRFLIVLPFIDVNVNKYNLFTSSRTLNHIFSNNRLILTVNKC